MQAMHDSRSPPPPPSLPHPLRSFHCSLETKEKHTIKIADKHGHMGKTHCA